MKQTIIFLLFATIAGSALAESNEMTAISRENRMLQVKIGGCVLYSELIFAASRLKVSLSKNDFDEQAKSVDSGKELVKVSFSEVKKAFFKNPPPTEFIDWRLEWMAAFGSAELKLTDQERGYLQRVEEAKRSVDRATNKLEISLE